MPIAPGIARTVMTGGEPRSRRTFANDAAALSMAAIVASVLAYGLLLVIVNGLGEDASAPVVLLWSYWVLATTTLGAPVQQWILRNSVVGVERAAERQLLGRMSILVVLVGVVATLTGRTLDDRLFRSASWVFPMCIGATTLGAWALGIARGRLAASNQYLALAASLPGENLIRVAAAIALIAAGADQRGIALVVPGGYAVLLALRARPAVRRTGESASARSGMLGSLTAIALISQAMFTSVPFVIALSDAPSRTVTSIFALLAVARLPHHVVNAMASRILDSMTQVAVSSVTRIWAIRRSTLLSVPVLAAVSGAFAAGPGRAIVRGVFGLENPIDAHAAVWITVGAVVAVGVLILTLSGVAVGRTGPVIAAGVTGLAAGLAVVVVVDEPEMRASLAFGVAELVYFAGLGAVAIGERGLTQARR